MRYFFLSFNYGTGTGQAFVNLTCTFERFPTQKEMKEALTDQMPYAKNVVLLGFTELTESDYETFTSER